MVNEVLAKFVAHNLVCLIHEQEELVLCHTSNDGSQEPRTK